MKIYTKGGDQGQTSLASGVRVDKDDSQVQLYGEADELNSQIGFAVSLLSDSSKALASELQIIQNLLFELASELAGLKKVQADGAVKETDIVFLEEAIDRMHTELEPLRAFILPGGHMAGACLHVARTVCRRLERQMVGSLEMSTADPQSKLTERSDYQVSSIILKYTNRLSDYLFVAARFANYQAGHTDIEWHARK